MLKDDALVTPEQGKRLKALVAGNSDSIYDLIPNAIRHKGGGTVNRFLRLQAVDPRYTDVLCFLSTRTALSSMQAEYSQKYRNQLESFDCVKASRKAMVEHMLLATTGDKELGKLYERYPNEADRIHIDSLIRMTGPDEVEQFRRALQLGSTELANRD